MNHHRFRLVPIPLVFFAALLPGCLPDDPVVNGQLLYPGSNIEKPGFLALGDNEPWVMFQTRRTRPSKTLGGTTDLHLVRWPNGADHRVVLEGRADRGEWPAIEDASGAWFYMTDEQPSQNGLPRGTLNRISLTEGLKETLPDVMGYALGATRTTYYYRKYIEGSRFAELHLRDLTGRDRNLGPLSGQVVMLRDDTFYYITGPTLTLMRVSGFDEPAVLVRNRVNRFQLGAGEKFALATVADEGVLKTVVLDFVNKTERPLPVDNPCCWLDLRGNTFLFSDAAKGDQPATLHYFDIVTGSDRVVSMPPGLADVVSIVTRPPADRAEALLFDHTRRVALYRPNADPVVQLTNLRPSAPTFSKDGNYLLYLVPEPPPPPPAVTNVVTGQLWGQDANRWEVPPRLLSPVGASVPVEPQPGFLVREGKPFPLVFWARYGLGASDLYLADHETGESLKVAQGIGEVSVSHTHVLGVLHMSQDLTGDLVYRDFATGTENVIEHGVADVQFDGNLFDGDLIAFVVHERMASSPRNGLWSTTLPVLQEPAAAPLVIRPPPPGLGTIGDEGDATGASAGTARDDVEAGGAGRWADQSTPAASARYR